MDEPDVGTVDIPENDAPQGFMYWSDDEGVTTKLFDMSSLPEMTSIYYTPLNKPICFIQRCSKTWLVQS